VFLVGRSFAKNENKYIVRAGLLPQKNDGTGFLKSNPEIAG